MNPFDNNVPDLDAGDIVRNKRDKTIYKSAKLEFVSAKGIKKTQFYKDASIKSVDNYQTKQSLLRGNALCDPPKCDDFQIKITQGNNASSTFDGNGIVVVRTDTTNNILAVFSPRDTIHGDVSGVVIDPSSNLFPIDECDKPGWKKLIDISGNCLLKNTKQGYLHYLGNRSRKFKMFSAAAELTPIPDTNYSGSNNRNAGIRMILDKWLLDKNDPDISQYGDIKDWDTSLVTDMSHLFDITAVQNNTAVQTAMLAFNEDISEWNVENVTNFKKMFAYADAFDKDLSKWKPSSSNLPTANDSNGPFYWMFYSPTAAANGLARTMLQTSWTESSNLKNSLNSWLNRTGNTNILQIFGTNNADQVQGLHYTYSMINWVGIYPNFSAT